MIAYSVLTGVHNGLGCRTNSNGFLEVGAARFCDPRDFGGETLDVVLLTLEHLGGDEHGEVRVLDAELLDVRVEPALDDLPDAVRPWLEDVAARDVVVVDHVRLGENLIPPH